MEIGYPTPVLDMLKHGQPVDRDIRLMAAQGLLGLRHDEQRGVLEILVSDPDPEIARAAADSLASGVSPDAAGETPEELDCPQADQGDGAADVKADRVRRTAETLAAMNPGQRLGRAMKGSREERAILIRDPNKIVALAVLGSPKISEVEVEAIAKMTNVSDEVLRLIGNSRAWLKNYRIVSALTRNPKTPQALSMNLLSRLQERDVKLLIADRNVPDALRMAARRRVAPKN
jgi:hypothetical protein